MFETILAAAPPPEANPLLNLLPLVLVFLIFYVVLLRPTQAKQRKLEQLTKKLQPGDKIILNPGIFGTVVAVEDQTLLVRVDEKTKIKVLRSAVAGLQEAPPEK